MTTALRALLLTPVATLVLVALVALGGRAFGHGDAQWIQDGGYRSPSTNEFCCGTSDCVPVPAVDVLETVAGWTITTTGEHIPRIEGLKSQDGRYWRCKRPDGARRCFFYPPGTS